MAKYALVVPIAIYVSVYNAQACLAGQEAVDIPARQVDVGGGGHLIVLIDTNFLDVTLGANRW